LNVGYLQRVQSAAARDRAALHSAKAQLSIQKVGAKFQVSFNGAQPNLIPSLLSRRECGIDPSEAKIVSRRNLARAEGERRDGEYITRFDYDRSQVGR